MGDFAGLVVNIVNLASALNSPVGTRAIAAEPQLRKRLFQQLLDALLSSASYIDPSAEALDLLTGGANALANHEVVDRFDPRSQHQLLGLIARTMDDLAVSDKRLAISKAAALSTCEVASTLLSSEALFGPTHGNSSNNTAALTTAMTQLASGTLVDIFVGMAPVVTQCAGLLVSGQKLDGAGAGGAAVEVGAAGGGGSRSFALPTQFAVFASLTRFDTVEASSAVRPLATMGVLSGFYGLSSTPLCCARAAHRCMG